MNRLYSIHLNTPMGIQNGLLQFYINDTKLSGNIISNNIKSSFSNGKIINNNFSFQGIINVFFLSIKYYADGSINKDKIKGTAHTKYGTFDFNGILKT